LRLTFESYPPILLIACSWKEDITITCKKYSRTKVDVRRKIAWRSKDSCKKDAREKKEKWKKRIKAEIRQIESETWERSRWGWSLNKERKRFWKQRERFERGRKEDRASEQRERANECSRGMMGRVFLRPMSIWTYKYVNEIYYIPRHACRCAITFEDLFVNEGIACTHAHLHELVIIPSSRIIKERLLCAATRCIVVSGLFSFFRLSFYSSARHSSTWPIDAAYHFITADPSICNLRSCYLTSGIVFLQ